MRLHRCLIVIMIAAFPMIVPPFPSEAAFARIQNSDSPNASSEEIPRDSVPQNAPCADQPRSLKELKSSFEKGRRPLASEMTGTWVEIGALSDPPGEVRSLNCSGERRGRVFEFVLVANGYSIELHAVGMIAAQTVRMKLDDGGGVEFREVDFGGDGTLGNYHCRLTKRGTLVCLIGIVGVEFSKIDVAKSQIFEPGVPRGWTVNPPRE